MSFLLRRNLPWAWAGWVDNFARPPESPAKQPWGHYGGDESFINSVEELQIPGVFGSLGKGPSYEFQPYTGTYGMEWEMYWPVGSLVAQRFNLAILGNWAKVGGSVTAGPLIQCIDGDAIGGKIYVFAADSVFDGGSEIAVANTSRWGGVSTVRVWVDDDKLVRIWRGNAPVLQCVMPASHRTRLTRRGMNFFNDSQAPTYLRWARVFDRPSDFPILATGQWTQLFYDSFERPDGVVDNGWTQYGANAALRSGSWATINTTDGNRGLIRASGNTNGAQRIEGVLGGFQAPTSQGASLVLRSNPAGTDGLLGTFRNGALSIGRFTNALSSSTLEGATYVTDVFGTILNNTPVAFCANGDYAWLEVDDTVALKCQLFGGPAGSWMGARVQRKDFTDSASWNSLRLMEAA